MKAVDSQVQNLLDEWATSPIIPISELTPQMVRASDTDVKQLQADPEPVRQIEDYIASTPVGNVPIRVYTPLKGIPPFPVFIFFHGGGFVIGGESYQAPIRAITNRSECLVCAVEYRLAPEYPFPAAVDDASAAFEWVVNNASQLKGDSNRIAIGGDSSGGNLAAVIALINRERKTFTLKHQVLIYPMLDATCSQPSIQEFATGYGFTTEKINWYFDQYLPKHIDRNQERISPLFAKSLRNLPPAYIATAECDPLRDEAEVYGARLQEAGVPITLKRYKGMIHGFFQMAGVLDQGKMLIDDIGLQLKKILSS